jgi:formylglycine-generating enzyme required for sulfatase activity
MPARGMARKMTRTLAGFLLVIWCGVGLPGLVPADEPAPRTITNSIGMKLTLIPKGEFLMGEPVGEKGPGSDAKPQHRVQITRPFYLGIYEVTQEEFDRLMDSNPSQFNLFGAANREVAGKDTTRFPVENVSWYQAIEFCNKLSEREHRQPSYKITAVRRANNGSIKEATVGVNPAGAYRLPTEAEWEYACRAGQTTPFHFGASLNGEAANCDGRTPFGTEQAGPYLARPTSVGTYRANSFGLFDMHGNVLEWCSDWYDPLYYGKSPGRDPQGPNTGTQRVMRGGGWNMWAEHCRAGHRNYERPDFRDSNLGFRVVLSPSSK